MHSTTLSRRRLIGVAALGGLALACGAQTTPASAIDEPEVFPLGFSLGSSILWASDDEVTHILDAVVGSGANSVRLDVSWTFAEPTEGALDWAPTDRIVNQALARNLSVLATITNAPAWAVAETGRNHTARPADANTYGRFCGQVAERYSGRITDYELWNEPNGQLFFEPAPDPEFYTQMLRAGYSAIKSVDPDARVVAGALGSTDSGVSASGQFNIAPIEFLQRMYDAGAHGSFDALSYHPYDYVSPLANGTLYDNSPMRQMISMQSLMAAHGDADKHIWITEYGAPTSEVGESAAAELVTSTMQQWQEVSFSGAFYVYTVRDADSSSADPENTFGVLTDDFRPKAAMVGITQQLAEGNPRSEVAETFSGKNDPKLGKTLSPVYTIGEGLGQEFELGSCFWSRSSYSTSPPEVAATARAVRLVPYGMVSGGMQNLRSEFGYRVFSRQDTGTHGVGGSILHAWDISLGFPITDEFTEATTGRTAIDFEFGRITWASGTDAVITRN